MFLALWGRGRSDQDDTGAAQHSTIYARARGAGIERLHKWIKVILPAAALPSQRHNKLGLRLAVTMEAEIT